MARFERFTFLCDASERRAIAKLAAQLQRSQSDAVRFLVVEMAKQLTKADTARLTALPAEDLRQEKRGTHVTD